MRFIEVDGWKMPRARSFAYSDQFIAYATGQKVFVLDRAEGEQLACFDKLKYQYSVYITPDEKMLVVRGTTAIIHFYSLETFTLLHRIVLRGYSLSQDHGSTISHDGQYFYFLAYRSHKSMYTELLKISLEDFTMEVFDFDKKLTLRRIIYRKDIGRYQIFGYDRNTQGIKDQNIIVEFDGDRVLSTEPFLQGKYILNVFFIEEKERYCILGHRNVIFVTDTAFQIVNTFPLVDSSNTYWHLAMGYHSASNTVLLSSSKALYAIDFDSGEIRASYPKEFGYLKIKTVDDKIAASYFGSGIIFLRLEE